jgi:hypothetical protein
MAISIEALGSRGMKRVDMVALTLAKEAEAREIAEQYGFPVHGFVFDKGGGFSEYSIIPEIATNREESKRRLESVKEPAKKLKSEITLGNETGRIEDILIDPIKSNAAFNAAAKAFSDVQLQLAPLSLPSAVRAEWRKKAWELQEGVLKETTKTDGACELNRDNPIYQSADFLDTAASLDQTIETLPRIGEKSKIAKYDNREKRWKVYDNVNNMYVATPKTPTATLDEEREKIRRMATNHAVTPPTSQEVFRARKSAVDRGVSPEVVDNILTKRYS